MIPDQFDFYFIWIKYAVFIVTNNPCAQTSNSFISFSSSRANYDCLPYKLRYHKFETRRVHIFQSTAIKDSSNTWTTIVAILHDDLKSINFNKKTLIIEY